MFDIGWTEILLIVIVAIICIGPKDLPVVLRTLAKWARKARALAREFQSSVEEVIRESELGDVRKEIDGVRRAASGDNLPDAGANPPVLAPPVIAPLGAPDKPPGDPKP